MWERVWTNERESAQQMIHATIKSQATEESWVVAFPNLRRVKLTMLPRRTYTHNISLSTFFFSKNEIIDYFYRISWTSYKSKLLDFFNKFFC